MIATVYLSRKLLNQLKAKETESKDLMLTHNLHNIIINGKRVGCPGWPHHHAQSRNVWSF